MRKPLTHALNHKLTQFVLILVVSYAVFQFGIPILSQLLTGRAAPIPAQVLWAIYMPTIILAMILYISSNEAAWEEFKSPLRTFMIERQRRPIVIARMAVLVLLPLLAGWWAYNQVQPRISPPAELRAIHPAPPGSITVDGEAVNLRTDTNPFRGADGSADPQALAEGKMIYAQYCVTCHGDALDGKGLFAPALRPLPADFTDHGTLGSVQEAFVFWRIAMGGPGMPHEGKGWNSAMPPWEGTLTRDQMWKVALYLYDATGQHPLTVDEAETSGPDSRMASVAQAVPAQQEDLGKAVYTRYCEACHGAEGDANTPAAENMDPRPRDLRRGWYEIRTTASGQLPVDADLIRVIQKGMPGSTMPGWESVLTEEEIQAVTTYIKTFSRRFGREKPASVETGAKVQSSAESIARGKEIYMGTEAECLKCHGAAGLGDGPSADELTEDAFGDPIFPADLTMPWLFRGGPSADDIYMRLKTGMTGSPMPSYADVLSDEDLWHLANYVDSLGPDSPSKLEPLITAARAQGALPDDPNAAAWQEAVEYYYPLFGQVMREERNFTPSISGVWVRALYNDQEIALRMRWHDRVPDQAADGGSPDGFAVQFPAKQPEGDVRPYFVFGDPANPVNLWVWSAAGETVEERTARGAGTDAAQSTQNAQGAGSYADGEYTLIIRRSLTTGDPEDIQLESGKFIPIAFAAWDGWTEEQLASGSITPWYLIYLDKPTPAAAFAWIPFAVLLTGLVEALGVRAVRRSAAREDAGYRNQPSDS